MQQSPQTISSPEDLHKLQEDLKSRRDSEAVRVRICMTGCRAHGAEEVLKAFEAEIGKRKIPVQIVATGCHGFCAQAPVLVVDPYDIFYGGIRPEDVAEIVSETIEQGKPVERLLYQDPASGEKIVHARDIPFYKNQKKIAFMDRAVLEGDPHTAIEGMTIAAYAIGASVGFVYVRAEYPIAVEHLKKALKDAEQMGFLGDNILGSGFSLRIKIKKGSGAFVCGEETALIASLEGKRGMPRPRPPFPVQSGIWGKPTCINNVETLANIPVIINNGGSWYSKIGTEKSKGTKVFALAGKVNNTGLVEVPMGITLKDVVFAVGGGIPDGRAFKAIQTGGPSGGCIPEEHLDLPVDYESLAEVGAIMGSGGMIVADDRTCMVDISRFFMDFIQDESCGKCVPCRVGTKRMLEILIDVCEGRGSVEDLELLGELAYTIKDSALCGLGQTAPNPVLTTLKYFRDEYLAHIEEGKCPAGVCKSLIRYEIIADKCTGCGACLKVCPSDAITGQKKEVHIIAQEKCIKCGMCYNTCRFDAISLE